MNEPDINLRHLYIKVPTKYTEGKPESYHDKSIANIIQDNDVFELVVLQDWLNDQILNYIGWDLTKPITVTVIENALMVFDTLGIKPKGCVYVEDDDYLGASDASH